MRHELDSTGINMSQKRIQSIQFVKPTTLTELYLFLGLVNYFRDHISQHSALAHSLHHMFSGANQQKSKKIVWTQQVYGDFKLKSLVNQYPKLYFINPERPIILNTEASDYGAYLCQVQTQPDGLLIEQPIRFLSGYICRGADPVVYY